MAEIKHKEDTCRDLLASVIEQNIEEELFFSRQNIGWTLREYARNSPVWVMKFVEQQKDTNPGLSLGEAQKHLWKGREDASFEVILIHAGNNEGD